MQIRFFTIPNLLTLSNLICGSFAAVAALVYGNLEWAFWLMVLAAVFDFFDGFVARLMKCSSPIGVQLDSLSDMISFGFVPAAILYVLFDNALPEQSPMWMFYGGVFVCFVLAAFSALRLAKFNIDETQHTEFCGLPTPANALFFASLGLISTYTGTTLGGPAIILLVPVMSWLMISEVRMFALKFQGFGWKGNQIRYTFLILSLVLIAALRIYSIPAIVILYILISLVRQGVCHSKDAVRPNNC